MDDEDEARYLPAIPPEDYTGTIAGWTVELQQRGLWDGQNPEWYGDVILDYDEYMELLTACEKD